MPLILRLCSAGTESTRRPLRKDSGVSDSQPLARYSWMIWRKAGIQFADFLLYVAADAHQFGRGVGADVAFFVEDGGDGFDQPLVVGERARDVIQPGVNLFFGPASEKFEDIAHRKQDAQDALKRFGLQGIAFDVQHFQVGPDVGEGVQGEAVVFFQRQFELPHLPQLQIDGFENLCWAQWSLNSSAAIGVRASFSSRSSTLSNSNFRKTSFGSKWIIYCVVDLVIWRSGDLGSKIKSLNNNRREKFLTVPPLYRRL